LIAQLLVLVNSCSNILITKDLMMNTANLIGYNADSAALYGSLYHYPKGVHEKGSKRDIWSWDYGTYLGSIPEAEVTYNVVGNVNEWGLVIGETTFGGISELGHQDGGIMDYGSLIWVTLQRTKTAREAIHMFGELTSKYGYASSGESFSFADQNEVWLMDLIGKGNYEKGAVWVAARIPNGAMAGHANQARITTWPKDDPENWLYAQDTVTFAQKYGLYPSDASADDFSFSDVYDPVTFEGARFCEARVWNMYKEFMGDGFAQQYWDYAAGYNLTNRMPLWIVPDHRIELTSVMKVMRSKYQNTWFDMASGDVSAQAGPNPTRNSPLTWTATDGEEYVMERPIATPQTGWNFIAQSRSWMPAPLAAVLWFGVDDSSTTVRFPIHGGATSVPSSFAGAGTQDGQVSPVFTFNFKSAFTVFNLVANWAYPRWNAMYPTILNKIETLESNYIDALNQMDVQAAAQYVNDPEGAVTMVTNWAVETGNNLVSQWGNLFETLFVTYRDNYNIQKNPNNPSCGCDIISDPYSQNWYDRIAATTGSHYKVPSADTDDASQLHAHKMSKHSQTKRDLLASR
jgi:dipeptidase